MIASPRPWSSRENTILKAEFAKGTKIAKICEILRRSKGAVARRIRLFELHRTTFDFWTDERRRLLIQMYMDRHSLQEISTKIERSVSAISKKLNALKIERHHDTNPRRASQCPWVDQDRELLTELFCEEGLSGPEIAKKMKRSYTAIKSQINSMGLAKEQTKSELDACNKKHLADLHAHHPYGWPTIRMKQSATALWGVR